MSSFVDCLLDIECPLIQAPMAGSSPAVVSETGGLGSLGAGYMQRQTVLDQTDHIRSATARPYPIGLFVLPDEYRVGAAAVTRARQQLDAPMAQEGLDV